jgi:hypothetical protein
VSVRYDAFGNYQFILDMMTVKNLLNKTPYSEDQERQIAAVLAEVLLSSEELPVDDKL